MRLKKALVKWRTLRSDQKRMWLRAAFTLTIIGVLLKLMSFSSFRKWFHKFNTSFPAKPVPDSKVDLVVWAVESAARVLPLKLLCLPQSLAVKYLLGTSKGVVMHIGVNKDATGDFQFHAWVEQRGKTIIGDLPTRYQPLWVWE